MTERLVKSMGSNLDVGTIMGMLGIWFIFLLVICVICYIVGSLGWYKLYKEQGYDKPWCAWVPGLSVFAKGVYLQTEMSDPEWFGWCMGLYWLLSIIPFIGGFLVFAGAVFVFVNTCRYIHRHCNNVFAWLSLFLLPIALPYAILKTHK